MRTMPSNETLQPCLDQQPAMKQQDLDAFVDQSIVRASEEFDQGNFYESCILLDKCANVLPEGHDALASIFNYMGTANWHIGSHDKALAFYKRSIKEDMKKDIFNQTTYMNIVVALLEQHKPHEALNYFVFLSQRNPQFKLSGNDMGRLIPLFVASGHYKEALHIYATSPFSTDFTDTCGKFLLVHVGIANAQLGMLVDASQYFQRYLDKMASMPDHPHVAMALYHFASLQARMGNTEKALELARESVKRYDALDLCADQVQAREARQVLEDLSN